MTKNKFLNKYGSLNLNYEYGYNLWNFINGWGNKSGGKTPSVSAKHTIISINDYPNQWVQLEKDSYKSHSRNEISFVACAWDWKTNTNGDLMLDIRYDAKVWINWSDFMSVDHTALYVFKPLTSELPNGLNANIVSDSSENISNFLLAEGQKYEIDLNEIIEKVEEWHFKYLTEKWENAYIT